MDILIFCVSFWVAAATGCWILMAHWFESKFFFPRVGHYWLGVGAMTMLTAVGWNFSEIESKIPTVLPLLAAFVLLCGGGVSLAHAFEPEKKWQQRENEKLANHD